MAIWFKLTTSAVLATTALVSSGATAPVFAAYNSGVMMKGALAQEQTVPADLLQQAQAIQLVHDEIFPALCHFGLGDFLNTLTFDSAYYSPGGMSDPSPVWNVFITNQYPKTAQQPQTQIAYFSAVLDAKTGELLSFEVQNPQWQGNLLPSVDTAAAKASAFLQTFEPNLFKELQLRPDSSVGSINSTAGPNGQSESFAYRTLQYEQVVNGLPFITNQVTVDVDPFGHIVGMRKQIFADSSRLPSAAQAIPLAEANKIYADALQMQKYYVTGHTNQTAPGLMTWTADPKLLYLPKAVSPIDALSGQFQSVVPFALPTASQTELQINATGDEWNAHDLNTVQQMVSRYMQTDLSQWTYTTPSNDRSPGGTDDRMFGWNAPANGNGAAGHIFATEDVSSGQIVSLQKVVQQTSKNASATASAPQLSITLQQGEAMAEQFLQSLLPSGPHEVFLTNEMDSRSFHTAPSWFDKSQTPVSQAPVPQFSYSFNLGYEGVPILDQAITVDLDPTTGAVTGFNRTTLHAVTLPENTGTVSAEQVKQNFLQAHPLALYYSLPQYHGQWAPNGKLLYGIAPDGFPYDTYDAFTGKPVDLNP